MKTLADVRHERELVRRMHRPARWYMRGPASGEIFELVRLTRPHRTRSLVLVKAAGIASTPWLVEVRELIQG